MFKKVISLFIVTAFLGTSVIPPDVSAQLIPAGASQIIEVAPTSTFSFSGIKIYPQEPFRFDFITDSDQSLDQQEAMKYLTSFMASLTVPEGDLWVNLSPYEPDRIVPQALGQTEMGRDMLAQDYVLKQLTASLMSPEGESGEKFWDQVYSNAYEKLGTTDLPVDSFNKVWIVPNKVEVYQNNDVAYITRADFKVMLESDYIAQEKAVIEKSDQNFTEQTKQIIRENIIPLIEDEVNHGESFSNLRQIFHSMILAKWYEQHFKNSVLGQNYVDHNTVSGIELDDKSAKQKIYEQYVQAFKSGASNLIKEEYDPISQSIVPRKYFVGGLRLGISNIREGRDSQDFTPAMLHSDQASFVQLQLLSSDEKSAVVDAAQLNLNWKDVGLFLSMDFSYDVDVKKAMENAVKVFLIKNSVEAGESFEFWKSQYQNHPEQRDTVQKIIPLIGVELAQKSNTLPFQELLQDMLNSSDPYEIYFFRQLLAFMIPEMIRRNEDINLDGLLTIKKQAVQKDVKSSLISIIGLIIKERLLQKNVLEIDALKSFEEDLQNSDLADSVSLALNPILRGLEEQNDELLKKKTFLWLARVWTHGSNASFNKTRLLEYLFKFSAFFDAGTEVDLKAVIASLDGEKFLESVARGMQELVSALLNAGKYEEADLLIKKMLGVYPYENEKPRQFFSIMENSGLGAVSYPATINDLAGKLLSLLKQNIENQRSFLSVFNKWHREASFDWMVQDVEDGLWDYINEQIPFSRDQSGMMNLWKALAGKKVNDEPGYDFEKIFRVWEGNQNDKNVEYEFKTRNFNSLKEWLVQQRHPEVFPAAPAATTSESVVYVLDQSDINLDAKGVLVQAGLGAQRIRDGLIFDESRLLSLWQSLPEIEHMSKGDNFKELLRKIYRQRVLSLAEKISPEFMTGEIMSSLALYVLKFQMVLTSSNYIYMFIDQS